jgi:hypothetical protein
MNIQLKEVTTKRTKMIVDDAEQFTLTFTDIVQDSVKIKETEEGYEVRYLVRDDNAISPDEDDDSNAFLVFYHRDFCVRRDKVITEDDVRDWFQGEKIGHIKRYHIFPVHAYIHSGVALSLSRDFYPFTDRWDVSTCGVVLIAKEEWKRKDKAFKFAQGMIETWNQYLSGEVYGIVVERFNKDKESIGHNSVWGFYGEKYALEALETEI